MCGVIPILGHKVPNLLLKSLDFFVSLSKHKKVPTKFEYFFQLQLKTKLNVKNPLDIYAVIA